MLFDVIIIGGGPAGLTAGMYTSRARLKSLLIEKGLMGGQVTTTEFIENYPGFEDGISGAELTSRMEKQAKRFNLETSQGTVRKISLSKKYKKISIEGGEEYEAKCIILCTGAHPKLLGVDGEDTYRGRGVSYCATCDGAFFKGEKIAVIGGGNSAVEEAVFLTKFAELVYIVHRRDRLRADKIAQELAFSNPKIKFIWNSVVKKIAGQNAVNALHIENVQSGEESVLDVQGIFIYIGYNPSTAFVRDVVNLNGDNYILADNNMSTSVPGIFTAGDVRAGTQKQIAVAAGDGATAAISAGKYIEDNF